MKGARTKAVILDTAVDCARRQGLDGLSIGRLAADVGLSKSGLFAHFKSKEALQIEVLSAAAGTFVEEVVLPALKQPRGTPRVEALVSNWLDWANRDATAGGCIFLGAAVEYDDRPGAVRDHLLQTQRDWTGTLSTSVSIAQDEGHLRSDVDPGQIAFELYGAMMAYHLYSRLLRSKGARQRTEDAVRGILERAR